MKTLYLMVLVVALVLVCCPLCLAAGPEYVGIVKSLHGDVVVLRDNSSVKADGNMKLRQGDHIKTGVNGKAGLIFEDDTVIAIGPNSSIVIDRFLFQPNEKKLSFIARIIQGTASYLSGQIAKLAPNSVRLETPHATVGMRGTHLLVKVD
ncbi:FecR domain-containing protein [Geobacter pelophilus]|uniref:FecR domain-containing protein n=1 Tax=Geoanaerobacter pelophilus TaxID=60036 RepID=A0AAW4L4B0_9BACT|nr:FecR domain-containing protein [Geoanaerobacter pelophilus]MBT0662889.1 FecR domain-containing protein [Geoanaerobacter pelophilus]